MKLQIFGKICLSNGIVQLDEETLRSKRLTMLLVYIVVNRQEPLTQQKLIDTFWEDNSKNPVGALKNLMYRLREALKIFGEEEYICTLHGAYQWNPAIPIESDCGQFEQLAEAIRYEKDEARREELCRQAINCFDGHISSKLDSEIWFQSMMTRYRSQYMDIVKILGSILEKKQQWSELETLSNEALTYDQLDEDLHYWMIKSMNGQKKYDLAMLHYERISTLLYGQMGIRSTERLQSLFQEIMAERGGSRIGITELAHELGEPDRPTGVFLCDYQAFRQIYRMEARRIERSGMAEFLLLLTVRRTGGIIRDPANDSTLMEGMDILKNLLCKSLRAGDVVSQYNLTQFLLLLPTCSEEACVSVAERIRGQFLKSIQKRRLDIVYELQAVEPTE